MERPKEFKAALVAICCLTLAAVPPVHAGKSQPIAVRTSSQLVNAQLTDATQQEDVVKNAMVRAVQKQMARCWRIDAGARETESLIVEILVVLNPDGSVRTVQIMDFERMFSDSIFRSAAENARRALIRCSPYTLPANKYEVWRDLTLRFDPSSMFEATTPI